MMINDIYLYHSINSWHRLQRVELQFYSHSMHFISMKTFCLALKIDPIWNNSIEINIYKGYLV